MQPWAQAGAAPSTHLDDQQLSRGLEVRVAAGDEHLHQQVEDRSLPAAQLRVWAFLRVANDNENPRSPKGVEHAGLGATGKPGRVWGLISARPQKDEYSHHPEILEMSGTHPDIVRWW